MDHSVLHCISCRHITWLKIVQTSLNLTEALDMAQNHLLSLTTLGTKGRGKGLDTCYSTTYISQTHGQQRFAISEVAADWHEPMVLQRIMWPSSACTNGQLDPWCS